jgi:hypothetical protein
MEVADEDDYDAEREAGEELNEAELERWLEGGRRAGELGGVLQKSVRLAPEARQIIEQSIIRVLASCGPVWELHAGERQELLRAVEAEAIADITTLIEGCAAELQRVARRLEEVRVASWVRACARRPVVGCTSTFAAQHLGFVRALKPRVVVIEEAGELLESQVMAAIGSPLLEHLVLIGDHKQLRPKITSHLLSRKRLDVSLFERLVESGRFPTATLQLQLRMRPEIADLTRYMYTPAVRDHPRVASYPPVRGVASSVFFLSHQLPEDAVDADATLLSKSHRLEAEFLVRLGLYLLQQGYRPGDLAFLTAYVHQVRIIRELIQKDFSELRGARLATVDNFQVRRDVSAWTWMAPGLTPHQWFAPPHQALSFHH